MIAKNGDYGRFVKLKYFGLLWQVFILGRFKDGVLFDLFSAAISSAEAASSTAPAGGSSLIRPEARASLSSLASIRLHEGSAATNNKTDRENQKQRISRATCRLTQKQHSASAVKAAGRTLAAGRKRPSATAACLIRRAALLHRQLSPRMVAISIRNLSKRFGGHTVLDRVNLEIGQGEMFFLLGPSGCGKTTLLRHVAGLVLQDSGELFFDGQDVSSLPPHRRHTALMFQSYALWPHLNVAQNIAFGLEEQGVARAEIRKRVAAALERIQMGAYAERSIAQLSGGQQQRVALARALIVEPRCLLLDEPLSNLDTRLRQELRQEIRSLCKQSGVTAIYVTHDQDEALSMADRLAVMDQGCIIQTG